MKLSVTRSLSVPLPVTKLLQMSPLSAAAPLSGLAAEGSLARLFHYRAVHYLLLASSSPALCNRAVVFLPFRIYILSLGPSYLTELLSTATPLPST